MSTKNKNIVILLSMVMLLTVLAAGNAMAATQTFPAFPAYPGTHPTAFPSVPAPFPRPFPTSTPTPSPTVAPSVVPSPTPMPTATNIYGNVKDSNGTAIAGVYALVTESDRPCELFQYIGQNGYYMICHVPFGNYSIAFNRNNTTAYSANLVLNHTTQKVNATLPGK